VGVTFEVNMSGRERQDTEAEAERIHRGAIPKMAVLALLFLVWQVSYFVMLQDRSDQVRTVDLVRTLAFLIWVIALLALFATGGAMFRFRRLRTFLDDERAVALRATCYRVGFWVMIALCILGYLATLWMRLRAVDAVHLVLSGGVLAVLATQVSVERD
jgi:heme/copper-type cytochrome/quinol oxidase subunit 2